jgi:oxygen-independent coproporphyrinogen-3 oxidase
LALLAHAAGLDAFAAAGIASFDGRRVRVSERGRRFLRSIAALFDAYLPPSEQQAPRHARAI